MAVNTDSTAEVIYEAMRQVLAARAIHNIFRMTETHLMVTSQTLRCAHFHFHTFLQLPVIPLLRMFMQEYLIGVNENAALVSALLLSTF